MVRSPTQIVLDTLSGIERSAGVPVACAYCGAVADSEHLRLYGHGPLGCVTRSDEDNIGTVIAMALRALEDADMIETDTLATEITASDGNGGKVIFRCVHAPAAATTRGRSDAAAGGKLPRCTVLVNSEEVTLDPRVFEGWARNALACLSSDY